MSPEKFSVGETVQFTFGGGRLRTGTYTGQGGMANVKAGRVLYLIPLKDLEPWDGVTKPIPD